LRSTISRTALLFSVTYIFERKLMTFKRGILVVLLLASIGVLGDSSATPGMPSESDQAIAAEKRVWEAEKTRDAAVLDASLGPDYVEIASGEGLQDRAAVIKELSTIELKEYSLTAMTARPVSPGLSC
jgi:hypothetical protein